MTPQGANRASIDTSCMVCVKTKYAAQHRTERYSRVMATRLEQLVPGFLTSSIVIYNPKVVKILTTTPGGVGRGTDSPEDSICQYYNDGPLDVMFQPGRSPPPGDQTSKTINEIKTKNRTEQNSTPVGSYGAEPYHAHCSNSALPLWRRTLLPLQSRQLHRAVGA